MLQVYFAVRKAISGRYIAGLRRFRHDASSVFLCSFNMDDGLNGERILSTTTEHAIFKSSVKQESRPQEKPPCEFCSSSSSSEVNSQR